MRHHVRTAFALSLVCALTACDEGILAATGAGEFTLLTVDGFTLPASLASEVSYDRRVTSGSLHLTAIAGAESSGTFTSSLTVTHDAGGAITTESFSASGSWTRTEAGGSSSAAYFYNLALSDGTSVAMSIDEDNFLTGNWNLTGTDPRDGSTWTFSGTFGYVLG